MIHFIFRDDLSINNFCENINTYLTNDGYILISTLDGDLLHNDFIKGNGKIQGHYVNNNGEKELFFEFIREYDKNTKSIKKSGLGYKFYNILFKEKGQYDNEYLVSKDYLIETFKKKCNLELIETDLFLNTYNQQKLFFNEIAELDENKSSKSYFMKIKEYYNQDDEINKVSLKFTKYHRFYIFKRNNTNNIKGGSKNINLINRYYNKNTNLFEI